MQEFETERATRQDANQVPEYFEPYMERYLEPHLFAPDLPVQLQDNPPQGKAEPNNQQPGPAPPLDTEPHKIVDAEQSASLDPCGPGTTAHFVRSISQSSQMNVEINDLNEERRWYSPEQLTEMEQRKREFDLEIMQIIENFYPA